jgi:hypothetical protein
VGVGGDGNSGADGAGSKPAELFASGNGIGPSAPPAASPLGAELAVLATLGGGGNCGAAGAAWIFSGCGVARASGTSRLDSIGPGSGGSPCLRKLSPGPASTLPPACPEFGAVPEEATADLLAALPTGGDAIGGDSGAADATGAASEVEATGVTGAAEEADSGGETAAAACVDRLAEGAVVGDEAAAACVGCRAEGTVVDDEAAAVCAGCPAEGIVVGDEAATAGADCAPSASVGDAEGPGGGGGAAAVENPARSCSSEYRAFARSAMRLCVSFSRSAAVIARAGGGGTVARFG